MAKRARFNLQWTLTVLAKRESDALQAPALPDRPESAQREGEMPKPVAEDEPLDPNRGAENRSDAASSLSDAERDRWLEKVRDDPRRAVRAAVQPRGHRSPGERPAW